MNKTIGIAHARSVLAPVTLLAVSLTLMLSAGCEQPKAPGQTYHKIVALWPILDLEKWEGANDDGTRWQKEKGDMICWLGTWEKERRYDKDGFLVYNKQKSMFFPIAGGEEEETDQFLSKKGSFLIWPYQSYRDKAVPQAKSTK